MPVVRRFRSIVAIDVKDGVAALTIDECHLNHNRTVHGSVLHALLDEAMTNAVESTTGYQAFTTALTVVYLIPCRPGMQLAAYSTITSLDPPSPVLVQGEIRTNLGGKVVAKAWGIWHVRQKKPSVASVAKPAE